MSDLPPNLPPVPAIPESPPLPRHPQPTYAAPVLPMYSELSAYRARPGGLTAIGVISIVVASLSCLFGLAGGCESLVIMQTVRMSKAIAKTSTITTTATPPPAQSVATDDRLRDGLPPADRRLVASVLTELQPMNDARTRELNAFLAWQGKHPFPTGGAPLTREQVTGSITSSNTLPPTDSDPGTTIFITSWGSMKVHDSGTDFVPADGSAAISVTSAESPAEAPQAPGPEAANPSDASAPATLPSATAAPAATSSNGAVTWSVSGASPASPGVALTDAEVKTAMIKAQAASGNKLTPMQLVSLRTALQDPNQTYILAGTAWSPVRRVIVQPDGSVYILFSGDMLDMDASGKINPMQNPFAKGLKVNLTLCGLGILDALVTIGLAVLLFLAALSVLRQSPHGRVMHLIYAGLKIPTVLAGSWVLSTMTEQFAAAFGGSSTAGNNIMIMGIVGCIYPIVLLIVMNVGSIKAYYEPARG